MTGRLKPGTSKPEAQVEIATLMQQYWKAQREKREGAGQRAGTLHLAQAQSNRGRRGRKRDFPDAERLVRRLVARELTLSFVPDAEERLWRTVASARHVRRLTLIVGLLRECGSGNKQRRGKHDAEIRSFIS
jgi:hypothetical protein